ncbi:MAG: 30S ribosomal protein S20 [Puniceicoccales bacterium]|jgi:small subunit ribosomal protein S20|nr:30S ribosomal protein S20 [Puniceicoccales bacterium]
MANIKSARKNIRKSAKRALANASVRSRLKTLSKNAAVALKGGDAEKIATAAAAAASAFDKAVKTGVIHRNKASRVKSKLAKNAAKAAPAVKPAATEASDGGGEAA